MTTDLRHLLTGAAEIALRYLETAGERAVARGVSFEQLVARLGGPLPPGPTDSAQVIELLARDIDVGLVVVTRCRRGRGGVPQLAL